MLHRPALPAQIVAVALKEWRLLSRNLHGRSALFLRPAIFVLVMSFTLKNTLTAKGDLPLAGWVQEDTTPFAQQWARQWLARHPGPRFATRASLQHALAPREVEAGVVVRAPLLDAATGRPAAKQLEMW